MRRERKRDEINEKARVRRKREREAMAVDELVEHRANAAKRMRKCRGKKPTNDIEKYNKMISSDPNKYAAFLAERREYMRTRRENFSLETKQAEYSANNIRKKLTRQCGRHTFAEKTAKPGIKMISPKESPEKRAEKIAHQNLLIARHEYDKAFKKGRAALQAFDEWEERLQRAKEYSHTERHAKFISNKLEKAKAKDEDAFLDEIKKKSVYELAQKVDKLHRIEPILPEKTKKIMIAERNMLFAEYNVGNAVKNANVAQSRDKKLSRQFNEMLEFRTRLNRLQGFDMNPTWLEQAKSRNIKALSVSTEMKQQHILAAKAYHDCLKEQYQLGFDNVSDRKLTTEEDANNDFFDPLTGRERRPDDGIPHYINPKTGYYKYGTRKCSMCGQFKERGDFTEEEEKKAAAIRICKICLNT